jgi:hypothetical protein
MKNQILKFKQHSKNDQNANFCSYNKEKECNTNFKIFKSIITNPALLVRKQDINGMYAW